MILTPVDSMLHWLTMIGVGEYCNDCNINLIGFLGMHTQIVPYRSV